VTRARVRLTVAAVMAAVVGVVLAGLVASPVAAAGVSTADVSAASKSITVGSVTLKRCHLTDAPVWCGSIKVPLDRSDSMTPMITIGFGWVPASGKASGTIVAQEGGPGYPSTGSAADYVDMIGSLHKTRNLLVVDQRGTGVSTLISCKTLQSYTGSTATNVFRSLVASCGNRLNHTFKRTDGSYVQASDLFGTANAARDLAAVLGALTLGKVDLYGDSYGTYFAQSFLALYPHLLRSVVLDSAYEARDLDPWYVTTVQTARTAFAAACRRSASCSPFDSKQSWARIGVLLKRLQHKAIKGKAGGTNAKRSTYTVNVRALVDLVNDAGYDYGVYRSLDAAVRAYLNHKDATPLLRLWAEDVGYDDSDYSGPVKTYSDGDYFAVACTDYPQLFDLSATPDVRRTQLAAAEAALPAKTFAPFSVSQWVSMNAYTESYTGCLDWPAPTHAADPPVPAGPMDATGVPVLVLNGDLDSLTPAAGGKHVARQIGSAARSVVVPNMVHLVALYDRYGCGDSIMTAFVRKPSTLHTLSTSCAKKVPEVHTLGNDAKYLSSVRPAKVVHGHASRKQRMLAAALVEAVGDAAYRYQYIDGANDTGLRGGTTHAKDTSDGAKVHLNKVRWTRDTSASGTIYTDYYGLTVTGKVTIHDAKGDHLTGSVHWHTVGHHTVATVKTKTARYHIAAP
jgi:pimeloyl-ACP methyl ester carboxylesterase